MSGCSGLLSPCLWVDPGYMLGGEAPSAHEPRGCRWTGGGTLWASGGHLPRPLSTSLGHPPERRPHSAARAKAECLALTPQPVSRLGLGWSAQSRNLRHNEHLQQISTARHRHRVVIGHGGSPARQKQRQQCKLDGMGWYVQHSPELPAASVCVSVCQCVHIGPAWVRTPYPISIHSRI